MTYSAVCMHRTGVVKTVAVEETIEASVKYMMINKAICRRHLPSPYVSVPLGESRHPPSNNKQVGQLATSTANGFPMMKKVLHFYNGTAVPDVVMERMLTRTEYWIGYNDDSHISWTFKNSYV